MYDFIDGKVVMKKEQQEKIYQLTAIVSGKDVENILIAALEGGISHWARLDCMRQSIWINKPPWLSTSQYATQILLEGGIIQFIDIKDPIVYYELTLQKLICGINDYFNIATSKITCPPNEARYLQKQMNSRVANEIIKNAILGRR